MRLRIVSFDPESSESRYELLNDIDAHFICSNPFKLVFTDKLGEHLTLSSNNEIKLFLDFFNLIEASYILTPRSFFEE